MRRCSLLVGPGTVAVALALAATGCSSPHHPPPPARTAVVGAPTLADRGSGKPLVLADTAAIDHATAVAFSQAFLADASANDAFDTFTIQDPTSWNDSQDPVAGWKPQVAKWAVAVAGGPAPVLFQDDANAAQQSLDLFYGVPVSAVGGYASAHLTFDTISGHMQLLASLEVISGHSMPSLAPSPGPSAGGGGGGAAVTMGETTLCRIYLGASTGSKAALIATLNRHLAVTFGSATVSDYTQILDQNCQTNPGASIKQVLVNLGYWGS